MNYFFFYNYIFNFQVISQKYEEKITKVCDPYIQHCTKMCFYMAVKSPQVYLEFDCPDDKIDRSIFRPFTKDGETEKNNRI
jgi:hypothetical protein